MSRTLSPFLYFRRNPGKTLPIVLVIVMAVTLVSSVVTIVRSINLTIFSLYGYNRFLTGITPRNNLRVEEAQMEKIRALPELGTLAEAHSYQVMVKTIFGKMVFPIFGLDAGERKLLLERTNVRLASGRMPEDGAAEALLSEDVAQNLGLKVGDVLLSPELQDAYAPEPVRLVGLLDGPVWLGLISKAFVDAKSPFTMAGYLAFAPTPDQRAVRRLDAAVERVTDRAKARVWPFSLIVRETQSALSNLYLILNIVVAIVVIVISIVTGLLSNIYFTQRLPEVATLSAIGYPRPFLLRRAVSETFLLCVVGWAAGGAVTIGLLWAVRELFLTPRGLLLNPADPMAFAFTLPLPLAITLFALVTLGVRLRALDPVSIIERRG